jgi:hypothetical protein
MMPHDWIIRLSWNDIRKPRMQKLPATGLRSWHQRSDQERGFWLSFEDAGGFGGGWLGSSIASSTLDAIYSMRDKELEAKRVKYIYEHYGVE